jgi:lipopolysaccharide/colanic/teichoic acid biosynthesis glycosyltransferase
MVNNAESMGAQVTVGNDSRITKMGRMLRDSRLDELPQLINIFVGDMSFVGTRPEVAKYVSRYSDEMQATLLLPAGVTSEASILYKDENRLLSSAEDIDAAYVTHVLPGKMQYNLFALTDFGVGREMKTMIKTVFAVCGLYKPRQTQEENTAIPVERQ